MASSFFVIMGPQGSGKGTQAEMAAHRLHGVTFSSGQLWRESSDPQLQEYQAKGLLASSDVIIHLVDDFISSVAPSEPIVSDGFPRQVVEAEWLLERLKGMKRELKMVVLLVVPRDESVDRLLKRALNETRPDDTVDVINQRLDLYESETSKVIAFWRAQGLLREVDGVGTVEEIAARINEALDAA